VSTETVYTISSDWKPGAVETHKVLDRVAISLGGAVDLIKSYWSGSGCSAQWSDLHEFRRHGELHHYELAGDVYCFGSRQQKFTIRYRIERHILESTVLPEPVAVIENYVFDTKSPYVVKPWAPPEVATREQDLCPRMQ